MRSNIDAEGTLLDALGRMVPGSSRTTLRQMLSDGRVRVNGTIEKQAKRVLQSGDVLDLAARETPQLLPPDLTLLYKDDYLLVVVKGEGLLTVATPGEREKTAQAYLNHYLRETARGERVHVVHRLDRESSGVLVFARDFDTREILKEMFSRHDIDRLYVAIVEGAIDPPEGTITSNLVENRKFRVRSIESHPEGKLAITHYKTVQRGKQYSMLEVTLETGRKNQIRVHFSEAGCPIIGDRKHGSNVNPIGRLGLHAKTLGFTHPVSGKRMRFEAPIPDELRNLKL